MAQHSELIRSLPTRLIVVGVFALLPLVTLAEDYPEGYAITMKIPLNATIQDVVDTLDQEGTTFTGAFQEQDKPAQLQSLRQTLDGAYSRFGQTNKEVALKLFDKKSNSILPTFYLKGRKYFLLPSSFRCLAGANAYQVFKQSPEPYFSQYALACDNLPSGLRLFGMTQLWIIFTSFEGEPPRSCIVAFANPDYPDGLNEIPTVRILQSHYGLPKLYFGLSDNCPEAICKLEPLKKLFPQCIQRRRGDSIWNRIVTTGCANSDYGDAVISFPFFVPRINSQALPAPDTAPVPFPCPPLPVNADCHLDYTLEWHLGSTRILAGGIESLGWLTTVHYVYYPSFSQLQTVYTKYKDASKLQEKIEPHRRRPSL